MEDNKFLNDNRIEAFMSRSTAGMGDVVSSVFSNTTDLLYGVSSSMSSVDSSTDNLSDGVGLYVSELDSLYKTSKKQTVAMDELLDSVGDIDISSTINSLGSKLTSIGVKSKNTTTPNQEVVNEQLQDEVDNHDNIEDIVKLLKLETGRNREREDIRKSKTIVENVKSMVSGAYTGAGKLLGKAGGLIGDTVGGLFSFIPGVGPLISMALAPILGGFFGTIGKALPALAVIGGSMALLGQLFTGDGGFLFKALNPFAEIGGEIFKEYSKKTLRFLADKITKTFGWLTTTSGLIISNAFGMMTDLVTFKIKGETSSGLTSMDDIISMRRLTEGTTSFKDSVFGKTGGVEFDPSYKGPTYVSASGMDHGVLVSGRTKPVYGGDFNLSRYTYASDAEATGKTITHTTVKDFMEESGIRVKYSMFAGGRELYVDDDDSPDALLLSPGDTPDVRNMNLGPQSDNMSKFVLESFQSVLGDTYQPYITSGRRSASDPNADTYSNHVRGRAIDIMTRYTPGGKQIEKAKIDKIGAILSDKLGLDYNVLYHDVNKNGGGYHFHIGYRPTTKETDYTKRNKYNPTEATITGSSTPTPTKSVPSAPAEVEETEISLDKKSMDALVVELTTKQKENSEEYTT